MWKYFKIIIQFDAYQFHWIAFTSTEEYIPAPSPLHRSLPQAWHPALLKSRGKLSPPKWCLSCIPTIAMLVSHSYTAFHAISFLSTAPRRTLQRGWLMSFQIWDSLQAAALRPLCLSILAIRPYMNILTMKGTISESGTNEGAKERKDKFKSKRFSQIRPYKLWKQANHSWEGKKEGGLRVPTCFKQGKAWLALCNNFTMLQDTQDSGSHRGLLHFEVTAWNILFISPPPSFTKAFNTTLPKHLIDTYGLFHKPPVRWVLIISCSQRMKSKKQ